MHISRPFVSHAPNRHRKLAVDLATRCNGEVINGDAMQLYEGLSIITNKIKLEERKAIPHHLLGCVSLREEPWTVQGFVGHAMSAINDIHSRKRVPILVGGTHYYLQSLLFEDSLAIPVDAAEVASQKQPSHDDVSATLDAPTENLFAELKRVDPVMAMRWHPNDRRKIRRSLEIFLRTGIKASELYEQQQNEKSIPRSDDLSSSVVRSSRALRFPTLILWTYTDSDNLTLRLDQRVGQMVDRGLLDEVQALQSLRTKMAQHNQAVDETRGIWVSIGYKEFRHYNDRVNQGDTEKTLATLRDAAVEQTKIATRRYAKAQIKWIRIKLTNALRNTEGKTMFVLETNNPLEWETRVLQPAVELTTSFVDGRDIPSPSEYSDLAEDLLTPKRSYDLSQRRDLWASRSCELCSVTVTTEQQWEQHLESRRHRSTLRAKTKQQTGGEDEDMHTTGRLPKNNENVNGGPPLSTAASTTPS